MSYIQEYEQLKEHFDISKEEIEIPNSSLIIRNYEFCSAINMHYPLADQTYDSEIHENLRFRYPVITKKGSVKYSDAIILLHGLNERTWHKHLTGAKYLAEKSGIPVILFPLSFHINRGLPEWSNARKMAGRLEIRKQKHPGIKDASLLNMALSERLTEYPQRFYLSGLQSMMDLTALISEMQNGNHPMFEVNTKTNLFAYSISCMLLQSLMISDPSVLRDSKIVLFAGGSLFSYMQGISKFILDSLAFETIRKYYLGLVNSNRRVMDDFADLFMENKFGKAFMSLITPDFSRSNRECAMAHFGNNLMVVALKDDRIMPVNGIREATGDKFLKSGNFHLLHFPYPYTHENPFPVLYEKLDEQVEKAFKSVFCPTLSFFTS